VNKVKFQGLDREDLKVETETEMTVARDLVLQTKYHAKHLQIVGQQMQTTLTI
jgi:hypothetical protein